MNELALFAGAGGGILGGHILGWRTVCAVEHDAYAIAVLAQRQNDGVLPPFPIWDDVRSFDGTAWRGCVDVVSGGFPCTNISAAGKGEGIDGAESGLWREMARIIGEVRPRFVFVENSPLLVSRGLARVLSDLASMGYDARWGVVGADDAGAPHRRKRIWIVASSRGAGGEVGHGEPGRQGGAWTTDDALPSRSPVADARGSRCSEPADEVRAGRDAVVDGGGDVADADSLLRNRRPEVPQREATGGTAAGGAGQDVPDAPGERGCRRNAERQDAEDARELRGSAGQHAGGVGWWQLEPVMDRMVDGISSRLHGTGPNFTEGVGRVATGVPNRVNRLKCIGNGQVPAAAAMAWAILTEGWNDA